MEWFKKLGKWFRGSPGGALGVIVALIPLLIAGKLGFILFLASILFIALVIFLAKIR
ncbi:MAG: hypothetical protein AB1498_03700 [bacterium]